MLFVLPRPVKKACERPPHAKWARPAGHGLSIASIAKTLQLMEDARLRG
jgi:hypothetical protein